MYTPMGYLSRQKFQKNKLFLHIFMVILQKLLEDVLGCDIIFELIEMGG